MAFQCSRMFASKQLSGCLFRNVYASQLKYPIFRSAATAASAGVEDFDEKNARLRRPQSPHLTIYKPQLTSVLSLTHRATGLTLGGIMTVWGLGGLFWSGSFPELYSSLQDMHLPAVLLISAKACIAFPFVYHYANGIRHLIWDMGKFLSIKEVYTTGYAVLGISAVLTAILVSFCGESSTNLTVLASVIYDWLMQLTHHLRYGDKGSQVRSSLSVTLDLNTVHTN